MKHPEGRITARTRSDRLLGCSSTSTGAGSAGRNTPTTVREWPEPAQRARLRPDAAQHERNGGLTNHFVRDLSCMISGGYFEQTKTTYVTGQAEDSRSPPNRPSRSEIEQRGTAQAIERRPVSAQPPDVFDQRLVLLGLGDVQVVDRNAADNVPIVRHFQPLGGDAVRLRHEQRGAAGPCRCERRGTSGPRHPGRPSAPEGCDAAPVRPPP